MEPRIARAVDLAHTAGAERRDDFIRPELRPSGQHAGFPIRNPQSTIHNPPSAMSSSSRRHESLQLFVPVEDEVQLNRIREAIFPHRVRDDEETPAIE